MTFRIWGDTGGGGGPSDGGGPCGGVLGVLVPDGGTLGVLFSDGDGARCGALGVLCLLSSQK